MTRRLMLAAGFSACLALSACGLGEGLYNAPLPGGAELGDHPFTVTVKFADVRDLVPQAGVKVNDVSVGRVSAISLERSGKVADVEVEVNGDVRLPANVVASIQQTSLLGEKYVALSAPMGTTGRGRLGDGDVIAIDRTTNGVEVEQVLGALSLLLDGGGLGKLNDITRELNNFADDNEEDIRRFFGSVNSVVSDLNTRRASITRALDSLATLSQSLRGQDDNIRRVLTSLAPGLDVITAQRDQVVGALNALNRLSTVTVRTLAASKDDIVADFRSLSVVLRQLAAARSALPESLQVLVTYPFADGTVAGIKGDFVNGFATVDLRTPGGSARNPRAYTSASGSGPGQLPAPAGLLPPTSSAAQGLPSTLTLSPRSSTAAGAATGSTTPSGTPPRSGSSTSGSGSVSGSGAASSSTNSTSSTTGGR